VYRVGWLSQGKTLVQLFGLQAELTSFLGSTYFYWKEYQHSKYSYPDLALLVDILSKK
jgi:hypothetical protein